MREEVHKMEKVSRRGALTFLCVFFIMAVQGIDLSTLSVSLTAIMKDFDLNTVQGGMLFSISTAGMVVGGILGGWLADRHGRLRVMQASAFLFLALICLSAMVETYTAFAVIRFFSSAGMAASWASGSVLVAEHLPMERRSTFMGLLQAANAGASAVSSLLNGWITPLYGWRPVVIAGAVMGLVFLLLSWFLRESESFAAYRSRQRNQKSDPKASEGARLLYFDRKLRRNLIKWLAAATLLLGGYYAVNAWLPAYMTDEYDVSFHTMTYFIAANYGVMFTGRFLAGVLADRFGRKAIWATACFCTVLVLPILILFANGANVGYIALLLGFFYGAPMSISSTFMNESFPTSCRGTGTSIAFNGGHIGSMVSTVMVGFIVAQTGSYMMGFVMIAAAYLLCGLLIFTIKEKQFDPSDENL